MQRRALVVEDDPDIAELVSHYLAADGFEALAVHDGREALVRARDGGFDLVVLDIQVPGLDGLAVCRALRDGESTRDVPIVMLTARGDESDRIVGLELGADDYVVKPFSPKELIARIRALFRRVGGPAREEAAEVVRAGELTLDLARHQARWQDADVHLTAKEFGLLLRLVRAGGRVLTRRELLTQVWGYSYAEGTRTVDVHVRRLRAKLPGFAARIVTVKSVGYRMADEP